MEIKLEDIMWLKKWFSYVLKVLIDETAEDELEIAYEDEELEDELDDKDIGKKPNRSKYIPRDRFDKVNAKAQQLEKLIQSGKAKVNDKGEVELIVPKTIAKKEEPEDTSKKVAFNELLIKKTDVDENSWPLVDRLQKQVGHFIPLMNQMYAFIDVLAEQQAIMREFAEHGALKKDSDFNRLMKDIEDNDDEFKALFKGKQGQKYYAAKRAFSKLQDMMKTKKSEKEEDKSAKFIIGKGETSPVKTTILLTEEKMAELSRTEEGRRRLDEIEKNLWKQKKGEK